MENVEKMLSMISAYCNENKYYSACIIAESEDSNQIYSFTGDAIGIIASIKLLLQQVCQSANIDYAVIAEYLYATRYDDTNESPHEQHN